MSKGSGRVAIIANADSFWVQRYISNVAVPLGQKVYLISASNTKYKQYYKENGIKVVTTRPAAGKTGRLAGIKTSRNTVRAVKAIKPDVIHVHYAYPHILRLIPFFSRKAKVIITFWGSDLLRANAKNLGLIKARAEKADALVVGAEDLYDCLIAQDISFKEKTFLIRMGLTAFDAIDKKRQDRAGARVRLLGETAEDRLVVAVGYNAGKAQQHLKVLESLARLPDPIKNKMIIILPLTYQNDDVQYLEEIKRVLKDSGIEGKQLTRFMDDEQIADLCLATDMFINAQITDAISGSMLEHIYAETIVINGNWLEYAFLEDNHIDCPTFSDFADLREVVMRTISAQEAPYDLKAATQIVKGNFSWSESRKRWEKVYEGFL